MDKRYGLIKVLPTGNTPVRKSLSTEIVDGPLIAMICHYFNKV